MYQHQDNYRAQLIMSHHLEIPNYSSSPLAHLIKHKQYCKNVQPVLSKDQFIRRH